MVSLKGLEHLLFLIVQSMAQKKTALVARTSTSLAVPRPELATKDRSPKASVSFTCLVKYLLGVPRLASSVNLGFLDKQTFIQLFATWPKRKRPGKHHH